MFAVCLLDYLGSCVCSSPSYCLFTYSPENFSTNKTVSIGWFMEMEAMNNDNDCLESVVT